MVKDGFRSVDISMTRPWAEKVSVLCVVSIKEGFNEFQKICP